MEYNFSSNKGFIPQDIVEMNIISPSNKRLNLKFDRNDKEKSEIAYNAIKEFMKLCNEEEKYKMLMITT